MTKLEQQRIEALTKDLKAKYGPVMRSRHIADFMHLRSKGSASNWIHAHGLSGRQAAHGAYYTDDVARAFVLGVI